MGRRIAVAVCVLLAVAAGVVWGVGAHVSADADRVIPVRVSDPPRVRDHADVGDSCSIYLDILTFFNTKRQIVVTDESGTIVAVQDMEGVLEEGAVDKRETQCIVEFDIPVPNAQFYTVYIGDYRIETFRADEFPIDPFERVVIMLD